MAFGLNQPAIVTPTAEVEAPVDWDPAEERVQEALPLTTITAAPPLTLGPPRHHESHVHDARTPTPGGRRDARRARTVTL